MARQLTPEETALFAADMASLPPEHGADVALKWRERCINLLNASQSVVGDGLAVVEAGVYTSAIGWWQGMNEAARDKAVLEWQTVTAPSLGIDPKAAPTPFQDVLDSTGKVVFKAVKDPTKLIWNIPTTAIPTALLVLLGGAGVGGASYNRYLLAPAIGGIGFGVGSYFRDVAYKKALEKQASAAIAATTTPTTTGGEGNPYRGFPRAA